MLSIKPFICTLVLTICCIEIAAIPADATLPASKKIFSLCAEPDFPPFMWFIRNAQGEKTTELKGYSIEVLSLAFERSKTKFKFVSNLPWTRCMNEVSNGKVDFGMDAYFDSDRAKEFVFSEPYMSLTPQVFFTQDKVKISTDTDLKKFRGCGLLGYSYSHYHMENSDLDMSAKTYEAVIEKTKKNRCDYFIEELEVIRGFKVLGNDYLADPTIKHNPILNVKGPQLHLLIGKKNKEALTLVKRINAEIKKMEKSGELAKIYQKYN